MRIKLKYSLVAFVLLILSPSVRGQVRCDPLPLPWFEDFEEGYEWSNGWSINSLDTTYFEYNNCWIHGLKHYSGWRSMTTLETLGSEPPYVSNNVLEIQRAFWHLDGAEPGEEYAAAPPFAVPATKVTFKAYCPYAYINPSFYGGHHRDTAFAEGVRVAVGYTTNFADALGTFVALDTVLVKSSDGMAKDNCCTDFRGAVLPAWSRLVFRVVEPMEDWRGVVCVYLDSISVTSELMPVDTTVYRDSICQGETYRGYGFEVSTQGLYGRQVLQRDSVADCIRYRRLLQLEVMPRFTIEYYKVLAKGGVYYFGDSIITTPGVYTAHYSTAQGCDSTVIVHVVDCVPKICIESGHGYVDRENPVLSLTNCTPDISYTRWSFSDDFVSIGSRVTHVLDHPLPDSVSVNLVTIDYQGCYGDTTLVFPVRVRSVWFPNAFTPDGEGNRRFGCVTSLEVAEYSLSVYNRQGLLVWSTTKVDEPWDGRRNGTPLPQSTYVYVWHLKDVYGDYQEGMGTVLLLR
ncbi:MAG: gliding motility-associated C-terminal domain-containing protein [Bacteroidales bacterium]|nr:gliding motility-associated C-terminal domain-containing protein [Bacteroidales bacterium]